MKEKMKDAVSRWSSFGKMKPDELKKEGFESLGDGVFVFMDDELTDQLSAGISNGDSLRVKIAHFSFRKDWGIMK